MMTARFAIAASIVLVSLCTVPAMAQDYGGRTVRFGNTSGWNYDGRNDDRDFPTNGFFPGNFAAHPRTAAIGAAGFVGSTPEHSAMPYPSQVIMGRMRDPVYCSRRYRSYDPLSGTFISKDGARHRCF